MTAETNRHRARADSVRFKGVHLQITLSTEAAATTLQPMSRVESPKDAITMSVPIAEMSVPIADRTNATAHLNVVTNMLMLENRLPAWML